MDYMENGNQLTWKKVSEIKILIETQRWKLKPKNDKKIKLFQEVTVWIGFEGVWTRLFKKKTVFVFTCLLVLSGWVETQGNWFLGT